MKTSHLIGLSRHRIGVDGTGVTTLVAFHGCPLRCKYCLNPQALSLRGVWKRLTPEELYNYGGFYKFPPSKAVLIVSDVLPSFGFFSAQIAS